MADETTAIPAPTHDEAREQYINSVRPVAAMLRGEGKALEAAFLIDAVKRLEKTPELLSADRENVNRSLTVAVGIESLKDSSDLKTLVGAVQVLSEPEQTVQQKQAPAPKAGMTVEEAQEQFAAAVKPVAEGLRQGGQNKAATPEPTMTPEEARQVFISSAGNVAEGLRTAGQPAPKEPNIMERARDMFQGAVRPVAEALRGNNNELHAARLLEVSKFLEKDPVLKGLNLENVNKALAAADKLPGLKDSPDLKKLREAVEVLSNPDLAQKQGEQQAQGAAKKKAGNDGVGLLDVVDKGGVISSFIHNFGAHFDSAKGKTVEPMAPTAAPKAGQPEQAKPEPEAAQKAVPLTPPPSPIAPQANVTPQPTPATAQAAPVAQSATSTVQPVAPTVQQPAPAAPRPEHPAPLYMSSVPMPDGSINARDLNQQSAHHTLFQIQVDPANPSRAALVPAPGADGRLLNDPHSTLSNAYHSSKLPGAGDKFVTVEKPTMLEKVGENWKITEKGTVGFAPTAPAQAVQVFVGIAPAQGEGQGPTAPTAAVATAFAKADLPVVLLEKIGMSADKLQENGQLDKLLRGEKTDLINNFAVRGADGQAQNFAAKMVLHREEDGTATVKFDLPKKELVIPAQLLGKEVTPAMRQELETTGRLSVAQEFTDAKGQSFKAFVGVDKEMNKVAVLRQDSMKLPDEIRGVKLSNEQREMITEGKAVKLAGLNNGAGKPLINATVQVDAARKGLAIKPDQADLHVKPEVKQEAKKTQAQEPAKEEKKGPRLRR